MQQEVDLHTLYKDVAADYVQTVMVPEQLPNVIDRAMRVAISRRTVTAITIPSDVQEADYSPPTHEFKMVPSSRDLSPGVPVPGEDDLRRAAEVLNAGEKVAIMVGQGARGAADEVVEVADVLGAGISKALLSLTARGLTIGEIAASLRRALRREGQQGHHLADHRQGVRRDDRVVPPPAGCGLSGDLH
jgi:thiamine pyrophosphate-dependent acetolactate synthase large subunit-like protein